MSFENSAIPLSLFTEDGQMLSPTKSQFMHKLEGLLESKTTEVRDVEAMIIDGNAVIQICYLFL